MTAINITDWLIMRPKWLQAAAKHYITFGEFDDTSIGRYAILCQQEADNEFPEIDYHFSDNTFNTKDHEIIRLNSISDIAGVNKLAPKKPLDFGSSNISIIYGNNGSGKSGYVRLLKHICGSRDCTRGLLHKNVFSAEDATPKATVKYYSGKNPVVFNWSGEHICEDLSSVDIFDTSFGNVFIGSENEVCFEPAILLFFSALVDVCERVGNSLDAKAKSLMSKMPIIPQNIVGSNALEWLKKLNANMSSDEIDSNCSFSLEEFNQIHSLQSRLMEQSPNDKAKELLTKRDHLEKIKDLIKIYSNYLSDEECKRIGEEKHFASIKKSAAEAAAKYAFSNSKLEGVASVIWIELWEAARKYSQRIAYKNLEFPAIHKDALCVLCHQPLSVDTIERFISFESYIKGETQKEADHAALDLQNSYEALPSIVSIEELMTKADAAGIDSQDLRQALSEIVKAFQERKTALESIVTSEKLNAFFQIQPLIDELNKIKESYEESGKIYLEDAKKENKTDLQKQLTNLESKKWLSEQKPAIKEETDRLRGLERIQEAKKKTNSTALSRKKGELAELLITESFIQRFNSEIKSLGCSRVKVKLIKSKVVKGKVLHTLQLDGAVHHQLQLNDVLSEGENRIVSIAAFIADVSGKNSPSPLVFDDPISSLDQEFEEAVVQRLCELAKQSQVIIFTHRLSLLGLVQDYAGKVNITPEIICVREETWGTGEPGDTPLFARKPDKALNKLIDENLAKAKKLLTEQGSEVYEPYAKGLCSDFRILLERMIEVELMGDIIQRYRRDVTTKGKIFKLAKITDVDCQYFDDMMTKYSRFEHSQSLEAPVALPKPDELELDFTNLKSWFEEFEKRR